MEDIFHFLTGIFLSTDAQWHPFLASRKSTSWGRKSTHYDSIAPAYVIAGDSDNPTRVCEATCTEFSDLKFMYEEAVSDYYISVL